MQYLKHYIDNRNSWNSFFPGSTTITFPLDQNTVNDLARSLGGDLSPENLHCDGEITRTQAQDKYNYYDRVIRELDRYCANQSLTMPRIYEY